MEFDVKDLSVIDELENEIGFFINKAKIGKNLEDVELNLIDLLDIQLYDFFISMKNYCNDKIISNDRKTLLLEVK